MGSLNLKEGGTGRIPGMLLEKLKSAALTIGLLPGMTVVRVKEEY
jgi:hypothetical protein